MDRALTYSAKVYTLESLLIHFEYLIPNLEIRIQMVIMPSEHTLKKILSKLNTEETLNFEEPI